MVKVFIGTDQEFYLDGYLKQNLDIAKDVIKKDWDMIFAVDGAEGSGKSVMAMCMGKYCDPTLTVDRVVFTAKEFRTAIIDAGQYQTVIYDEAYTGLSSRAAMSLINRTLVSVLAEIRQKNLFIFVVMPCFFDLDKYVALWRSRALIHVYTSENFERGRFAFYNMDKKKALFVNGKKYYTYAKPRPNFIGRFTNHYPVDQEAYKKKKRESLTKREEAREKKEMEAEVEEALFNKIMELGDGIKHTVKMKLLSMPASTYYQRLKKWKEEEEENAMEAEEIEKLSDIAGYTAK